METPHRMPLHDLPLEQFLAPGLVSTGRTPRKHKRPLSPSRTTLLNPAKRRVLDADSIMPSNSSVPSHSHSVPFMLSNIHMVTPTRPSRLGNGLLRNYGDSKGTSSPLLSHPCSPSREPCSRPTIESCTDPQSRHYPGFDIFRDREPRRGSPAPRVTSPSDSDTLTDKSEEDKENVPLRRTKKLSSKKRLLTGLDSSNSSRFTLSSQTSKGVVHPERIPFSVCKTLR